MKRASAAGRVAQGGLLAALTVALLYVLTLLPTMRLTILFVLSVLPVALAHERRFADGIMVFAVSTVLSGLFFPAPGAWVLYVAFFGWYGIAREWIVTRFRPALAWPLLFLVFNAAAAAIWFLAREALLSFVTFPVYWLIPVLEIAFAAYDFLFGRVRAYYAEHLRRHLFRG